jgi:hypothetical protein
MATVPKKTTDRLIKAVSKFQKILKEVKDRDISEADTVKIVTDILAEVFGFDKYTEITGQYAIKGTYCDLAIKVNEKVKYLIEVKRLNKELKSEHLSQAIQYGSTEGLQWIVLTNGISWQIYRIKFKKPLSYDLVNSFDFLELNPKNKDDQEKLFILCRKGVSSDAREELYEYIQCANRHVIGALLLTDNITNVIRRDLKKLSIGLKIEISEIEKILKNEVIKREVLEGEVASKAKKRIKKIYKATNNSGVQKTSTEERTSRNKEEAEDNTL